ncbi:WD40 repeat-like protein [Punctularia strigosozonata HHB-11173 SS5]|uniref:WD40 repeat-like protein n=1 Tax=Punctularia strigosozonata (strain HHB-11173) TaxID=741275 RepID=UPI00044172CC|nr:WD40 repeat-like protein [Punctularia strigosozonata HHB-11173 SS5]EIN14477.1 WD40 repeat-like protein [Punctularia strigosozonata HHB-11173 SS5]
MYPLAGPSRLAASVPTAGSSNESTRLPTKHAHAQALGRGRLDLENQRYIFNERSLAKLFAQNCNMDSPGADGEVVDGTALAVPRTVTVTRPPSLSDFSIISPPGSPRQSLDTLQDTPTCGTPFTNAFATQGRRNIAHTFSGSGYLTPTSSSTHGLGLHFGPTTSRRLRTPSPSKGALSRIWDAFASPARSSSRGRKGKGKGYRSFEETFDYRDMDPLDGEEGELIDEACFIDVKAVTGIDILSALPPELALNVLLHLDLPSIVACLSVSRTWRAFAEDNAVWRALFDARDGWRVDLSRWSKTLVLAQSVPIVEAGTVDCTHRRLSMRSMRSMGSSRTTKSSTTRRINYSLSFSKLPISPEDIPAPLMIDWRKLFQSRLELDRRWASAEPRVLRLSGHSDSVYCLEFDSKRIITGSRDRSIKVWALNTGKLLGTFKGHDGSVLCLKFDKDWDLDGRESSDADSMTSSCVRRRAQPGLLVSGSSDCTIKVWDLFSSKPKANALEEVRAEVRAVLRGHAGGVLDLKIDDRWIVSCSKDAIIRVWDRETLTPHCELRGHDGPVNAVGLQNGRVVSASGDGKMMMWDVLTGQHLRTFDGHDRGLACIDFKEDLIVSGSNDCKIKVWSASTGECLQTLSGHDSLVRALAFDPASGRLVSASYDRTVKMWDLRTGRMVRELKNSHISHIFDVKFDVRRIVRFYTPRFMDSHRCIHPPSNTSADISWTLSVVHHGYVLYLDTGSRQTVAYPI